MDTLVRDIPPPHDENMEKAVLCACMIPGAIWEVIGTLKPEMFYNPAHQEIFESMVDMVKQGKKIDLLTITDDLRQRKTLDAVGGPLYLTKINGYISTDANITAHATVVKERFMQREMLIVSAQLYERVATEDIHDLMEFAETRLLDIGENLFSKRYTILKDAIGSTIKEIEEVQTKKKELIGIGSGLTTMDRVTGGWQKTDLIIVAGRPSMGKTAVGLSFALAPAMFGIPTAFFSLEMSTKQLATRYISGETGYSPNDLRQAKFDKMNWEKIDKDIADIVDAPVYIDDTPALGILEFRSKARRMVMNHDVQLLVVDYLQLMRGHKSESREREISSISQALKATAKELDVPIIAMSQLNRSVESRADKTPLLSDLRESGSIEQDADIVIFVYREEMYDIEASRGEGKLIVSKHRNGPLATIEFTYNEFLTKIADEAQT